MKGHNCAIDHHPTHPEHGHGSRESSSKHLKRAIFLAFCLVLVQAIGSYLSGSLALLADTAHVFSDAMALVVTLVASYLAQRPASKSRTYGYYRIEVLAALLNGIGIVVIAFFILKEAYVRFLNPPELQSSWMLGFAIIGLLTNIWMLFILKPSHHFNLNMRGAYLHILGDTLSSVVVVGTAIVMMSTHAPWLDAVASASVALIITWMALRLTWDSVHILLEGRPKHLRDRDLENELKRNFPQIINIHDFHVWEITNELASLTAHLEVKLHSMDESQKLLQELNGFVNREFGISHTTFQIEKSA